MRGIRFGTAGPSIASGPPPGNRRGTGETRPPVEGQFKPGASGNLGGRPRGDAKMRGLLAESFNLSRREAVEALRRRWASTKHVQDMVELYARLEGELTKEGTEGARGIQLLILNNQGEQPLNPDVFRQRLEKRALRDRASQG